MQNSDDSNLLAKGEEYIFKLNTVRYKKLDYNFEVVLSESFLLIYENDIMKLFNTELKKFSARNRKREFKKIIEDIYEKKMIKVEKSRYTFMTKDRKRYVYYSLETVYILLAYFSFKGTINTDILEFLDWGTNKQKNYLSDHCSDTYGKRKKILSFGKPITEYVLPQDVHIGSTVIHTSPQVIAEMNAILRNKCEEQRQKDTVAMEWAKTHGAG